MGKVYKQLSVGEKTLIQAQLTMGFKPSHIDRELGRSAGRNSHKRKLYEHTKKSNYVHSWL